jgi:TOBE domain-containing protein
MLSPPAWRRASRYRSPAELDQALPAHRLSSAARGPRAQPRLDRPVDEPRPPVGQVRAGKQDGSLRPLHRGVMVLIPSNLINAHAQSDPAHPEHCTVAIGDFRLRAGCGDVTASGPVKVVARPERLQLLEHSQQRDNCLPGLVERTVYVGASVQVMVRLATGAQLQASIANTGDADSYQHGTPVAVHIPPEALRILGDSGAPPARDQAPDATPDPETAAASA